MLVAIVGSLGKGKTLALTYLAWNNFFIKKRRVYANYTLYGIPFTPIKTLGGLMSLMPLKNEDVMQKYEVVFCGDELWRWVSSRTIGKGSKERKDIVDRILIGSRKAFVTILYTTQNLKQVDPWVRNITDLYIYPILYNGILNLYFLSNPINNPTMEQLLRYSTDRPVKVIAEPFFAMYNTYERVPELDEGTDDMEEIVIDISENPALQRYFLIDLKKKPEDLEKYIQKIKERFWLYDEESYKKALKEKTLPYLTVQ